MEAQYVTHCSLLCISASFLHVQRKVRFSGKETLGVVQHVGEEFSVGLG